MKSLSKFLPIVVCMLVPLFGGETAAVSVPDVPGDSPGQPGYGTAEQTTSAFTDFLACCVDECTDDPGVDVMSLEALGNCMPPPGECLEIQLWQRHLDQLVVGYQAFMCFDPEYIQVCDIVLTDDPYGLHMIKRWDNVLGTIDLIAGIDEVGGQEPTDQDALLAIITVEGVVEGCDQMNPGFENKVCFRDHLPPTRFSEPDADPVYPCLKFTEDIVIDWTPPELHGCPTDLEITVECDEVPPPADVTATDNCDQPKVVFDEQRIDGDCPDNYTLIRNWTATDFCGNSASCETQTIHVQDTTPPDLHGCPTEPEITVECDAVPPPEDVTATDNCDPGPIEVVFDEQRIDGDCQDEYTLIRNWTATDRCGNSASCDEQIIHVVDTTPPELFGCPTDLEITVECDEDVPVPADVTATDNCDPGPIEVVFDEQRIDGDCKDEYDLVRNWTATDRCGNPASCDTQTIHVVDTTPPTLFGCPTDLEITVECDEEVPPPADVTATDNCDPGPIEVVFDEQRIDGDCEDEYTLIRNWTATDRCGNPASCDTQTIYVVDTTPPTLFGCPTDLEITVECDEVPDPANVTATDNCDPGPITVVFDEQRIDGDCPDEYTLIRNWTATDRCGNSASCDEQIIHVVDTTPPTLFGCPTDLDITVECDEVPDPALVTATDNCDPGPITVVFDEQRIDGDCEDEYTLIRNWTATDRCGNPASCDTQTIHVVDTTPPTLFGCPTDLEITVECDDEVLDPPDVTATDNCDPGPITVVFDEQRIDGDCEDEYTLIRNWTATDRCGNSASCDTQTIYVVDTTAPTLFGCPTDLEITVECDDVPPPADVTATDNCDPGPITVVFDEQRIDGDCEDEYTLIRNWTATDRCGNSASCDTQTIHVVDTTPPTLFGCPTDLEITVECDEVPDPADVTATDNCDPGPITVVFDEQRIDGDCEDEYTLIRNWTATDRCGNSASCDTQTIYVVDTTPPEFVEDCPLPRVKVFPNVGECFAYVCLDDLTATDNCDDDVSIEVIRDDGMDLDEPYDVGDTTVWWLAEDNCGNTAICWQVIQVEPVNLMAVYVEVQGVLLSPVTRCVTFELWDCPGDLPFMTIEEPGFFLPDWDRSSALIELRVPCEYTVSCMTAQDRLHTTRSTDDQMEIVEYTDDYTCEGMVRTMYLAEYVGPRPDGYDECRDPSEFGHWLLSGNFDFCNWPDDCDWPDCDYWVDILDFGVFWNQFDALKCYDSNSDGVPDGNTTCPACDQFMHADANGDGCVTVDDFAYFLPNLLCAYEPNCCGAPGAAAGRGPITRISVEELHARGWGELAGADLNHDGWLDLDDIEAFMNGAGKPPLSPNDGGARQADPDGVQRP